MVPSRFSRWRRSLLTRILFPILGGAVIAGIAALMMWLVDKYVKL